MSESPDTATARVALARAADRLTAAGIPPDEARFEVLLLLLHATGWTREFLMTRGDPSLTPEQATRFSEGVARRERREPLAYVTGERWFYGLPFSVTPSVLIPRPETELLVEIALAHPRPLPAPRLLDVGTGSGCVAVALAKNLPDAEVHATDLSPDALTVARENAARNGVTVAFHPGDLTAPVTGRRFDGIVSNPPYIAPDEIARLEPEVRDWEPRLALGTDPDPLQIYRRLAAESLPLLAPGGLLAVEVGQGQAEPVADILRAGGYEQVSVANDLAGIGRVVSGKSQRAEGRRQSATVNR